MTPHKPFRILVIPPLWYGTLFASGCGVQQSACQGFQQGCPEFQGCTGCEVQQGACLGSACSGQGCGQRMPCVSGQGQNLS